MLDTFLRITLVGVLAFVGLVVGAAAGSAFVPEGSAMAGPAIVLWYGLGGLLLSLAAGTALALRAGLATVRAALFVTAIVAALAASWIGYRVSVTQSERVEPEAVTPRRVTLPGN